MYSILFIADKCNYRLELYQWGERKDRHFELIRDTAENLNLRK